MNILIVEDEIKTAKLLKKLIESQSGFIVVSIKDSIESTVNYIKKNHDNIDLIFLDIQLADGHSFEIFNHVQINIPIVFCTAYDEYVLQAFKNNGIDYILKPFDNEDIINALKKINRLKESLSKDISQNFEKIQSIMQKKNVFQKSIIVHVGDKMIPISVDVISLFHLENETVKIYTIDKKKYSTFKRMDIIQSLLNENLFFRINRQMIINRHAIKAIEPWFNRKVKIETTISLTEDVIVSRLKVAPFLKWIEKPI
jgi:DNA-binding LytR/AlgR family response regulator